MLMFVIDPAAFGNRAAFQQEVFAMVDYIHSTTPARGFDKVRVPGDPEREALAARDRDGIEIDDNSWDGIVDAARHAGLSDSEISALTPLEVALEQRVQAFPVPLCGARVVQRPGAAEMQSRGACPDTTRCDGECSFSRDVCRALRSSPAAPTHRSPRTRRTARR